MTKVADASEKSNGDIIGDAFTEGKKGMSTGLFDCFSDPTILLYGLCFPCCLYSQVVQTSDYNLSFIVKEKVPVLHCLLAMPLGMLTTLAIRIKTREKYGLKARHRGDCLATVLCGSCSLCQVAREVKKQEGKEPTKLDAF
eukprot:TRINITY_DN16260_c0_g1_i1.p1 TRINITY_DN16260_c0_g1~~TRINITY_DN16260_c0_g1_i1.p1  ORF type:complete len:149 (-),score=29.44 TRINITY_DN16260_c0_g1_i1:146-568(-)